MTFIRRLMSIRSRDPSPTSSEPAVECRPVTVQTMKQITESLLPGALFKAATTQSLKRFVTLWSDAPLLVIKLRNDSNELVQGLSLVTNQTAAKDAPDPNSQPMDDALMVTDVFDPTPFGTLKSSQASDPGALRAFLEDGRHFALSVKKRPDAESLFATRISIGRARNKDIVLRDQTVSKFHGWFLRDEGDSLSFADAGSTNGTHINGTVVKTRGPQRLRAGDRIRIGSVETMIATAELLWNALHPSQTHAAVR